MRYVPRPDWELVCIVLAFVATNAMSQVLQSPISINDGKGWDGVHYYAVAHHISNGSTPQAEAPYIYRVGTPLLAALTSPEQLMHGFKVVNVAANAVATILLYYWLRYFVRTPWVRTSLVILFVTQWHGPVRFVYYYPVLSDPWLHVFLLAGLLAAHQAIQRPTHNAIGLLTIASSIGAVFREVALITGIAFFIQSSLRVDVKGRPSFLPVASWTDASRRCMTLLPVLCGLVCLAAVHLSVRATNGYSFPAAAFDWAYRKSLLTYIHAVFITYGVLVILPLLCWKDSLAFLMTNSFMGLFLGVVMVLAWIGGSDTERILYWGMPVVYVLIGRAIERDRAAFRSWFAPVIVVAQCISQRWFWTLPADPFRFATPSVVLLTIPSSRLQYLDLFSALGAHKIQAISLVEYLGVSAIIVLWLRRRTQHVSTHALPSHHSGVPERWV